MIAVDVNNIAELYDVGLQVLEENLGPQAAQAFLNMSFPGRGDYTAEKQTRPPRTTTEMDEMKTLIIEEAMKHGNA